MERSSGGKAVQRTLGSDERISRKKSGPGAGGVKRRGRHSLVYRADMGTDTIDQIAKAEIVPVAGNRKNCEVAHIRAAEISAKVRVRCIRRAPRPAHARARSMPPIGRVIVTEIAGLRAAFATGICRCFIDREHRPPMIALVRKFCADETGATAIEYGLIAAGISLAIIAVVNGIGAKLNTKFTSINTSLK
jgi:pilus assembly protein Flp/PilA